MASLERKLLDGPSAGYCSDSGEEDTGGWKVAKDEDTHQSNVMRELGPAMTGPKGVLNEFSAFREQVKQDREKQMRTLSQRAQKGMMQGTKEEREKAQASSDEDEDGLESLRARRIQEMKKAMSGRIVEVTEKEQFSQATDSCSGYLLSVLIYEPGDEACEHLTHLIKILAAEFPRTKFIRARSTLLGTSKTFKLIADSADKLIPEEVEIVDNRKTPMGILFVCKGSTQEHLLFMHPNEQPEEKEEDEDEPVLAPPAPVPDQQPARPTVINHAHSDDDPNCLRTPFGLSTVILASILCVKERVCNMPFELKVDDVLYVGYPMKVTTQTKGSPDIFHIVFVLSDNVEPTIVDSFQTLSRRLAYAVNDMQTLNGYLHDEANAMHDILEKWQRHGDRKTCPWELIRNGSKFGALLAQIYDDVEKTGVVQALVDNFIEVGFCVESRALAHAHLTPRNRQEIDWLVKQIRPYHGILLLEDISPSPDANPSVALLIRHCDPDRSILDMSTASGIPLLQVLLIVRHLLTWARAIVIYPICNTNIYTSATNKKSLVKEIRRYRSQFGEVIAMAEVLAVFNPPNQLSTFVHTDGSLVDQQMRTRIVVYLLRNQLIMQLHRVYYIFLPMSDADLPRRNRYCPEGLKQIIDEAPSFVHCMDENFDPTSKAPRIGIPEDVKPLLRDICGRLLETNSYSSVESRLRLFCRMSPYMNGHHHLEDVMYRMNQSRKTIEEVISTFSLLLCDFLRPDSITSQ